ncbi:MAG: hypothetical protein ABIO39_01735 [Caulobacteraceae bacterium]
MLKQKPESLPWAKTVRFSEDGVSVMVGDALWGSIRAAKTPVMYAADPSTGQVAWFGIVGEHGDLAYLALRLKVEAGNISEIETVLNRTAPFDDGIPFKFEPMFGEAVAAGARKPRASLIAAVNAYLDNSLRNDGKVTAAVAGDCVRMDNGKAGDPALGRDCAAQLKLGAYSATNKIRARAFPVVDEARGVVVVTGVSDFSARVDSYKTSDGVSHPTKTIYPESQAFTQMFKIGPGGIQRVETVFTPVPYLMPSPWTH